MIASAPEAFNAPTKSFTPSSYETRAFHNSSTRSRRILACARYASVTLWRAASAWLRAASFINHKTEPEGASTARSRNSGSTHELRFWGNRSIVSGDDRVGGELIHPTLQGGEIFQFGAAEELHVCLRRAHPDQVFHHSGGLGLGRAGGLRVYRRHSPSSPLNGVGLDRHVVHGVVRHRAQRLLSCHGACLNTLGADGPLAEIRAVEVLAVKVPAQ